MFNSKKLLNFSPFFFVLVAVLTGNFKLFCTNSNRNDHQILLIINSIKITIFFIIVQQIVFIFFF